MTRFVLDASITLAWLIDAATPAYATQVRQLLLAGGRALVPALWQWEVANGFVIRERRGLLTPDETAEILWNFESIRQQIEVRQVPISVRHAIDPARKFGLTAYDAAYLALAQEEHLPLATLDDALKRSAKRAGVELLK